MRHLALISAVVLSMTACDQTASSESSNPEEAVLDGVLINMGGLHYQTETQSGVTTLDGQFQYVEGETVTFSVGGSVIGSIAAEPSIELYDLLNGTHALPTTALDLRLQLRSYQGYRHLVLPQTPGISHYTGGSPSGVHWASNVVRFLLGLDTDNSLENGIDLISGKWNTVLADTSIDFNKPLDEFANPDKNFNLKATQQKYQIEINMGLAEPLMQLYIQKGLDIEGKVRTGTSSLSHTERSVSRNIFGRKLTESELTDGGTRSFTTEYEYNGGGSVVKKTLTRDTNNDGNFENQFVYEYDLNNFEMPESQTDTMYTLNNTGTPFHTYNYTREYLDDGLFLTKYYRVFDRTGGPAPITTYDQQTYTYDENYNQLTRTIPSFNNAGEIINEFYRQWAYTYDEQNRIASQEIRENFNSSGVPATIYEQYAFTYGENVVEQKAVARTAGRFSDFQYDYKEEGIFDKSIQYNHQSGGGVILVPGETPLNSQKMTKYSYLSSDNLRFRFCEEVTKDSADNVTSYRKYGTRWNEYGIESVKVSTGSSENDAIETTNLLVIYGDQGEWSSMSVKEDERYSFLYVTKRQALADIIFEVLETEVSDFNPEFAFCGIQLREA